MEVYTVRTCQKSNLISTRTFFSREKAEAYKSQKESGDCSSEDSWNCSIETFEIIDFDGCVRLVMCSYGEAHRLVSIHFDYESATTQVERLKAEDREKGLKIQYGYSIYRVPIYQGGPDPDHTPPDMPEYTGY